MHRSVQLVRFGFVSFSAATMLLAGCQAAEIPLHPTQPIAASTPVLRTAPVETPAATDGSLIPWTPTPSVPLAPAPSSTVETAVSALDLPPIVDPQHLALLEPLPLDPMITAPLIFLGDWSPGDESPGDESPGAYLPVYTFTHEQLAGLNLIPEGPVTYPPVALHFVEAGSGRVCDYPRQALVGQDALAWLPDGSVAVREEGGWWSGLPCTADFQPVADPQSLTPFFPDPGLSPDGRYRANRFFDIQAGIVNNETTLTAVDSGEAVQTIAWQQEERLGDWAEAGPGGRWLDERYFLIPQTSDQGPLLVQAGQDVIPILSEFFAEPFAPCTPEACRIYRAEAVVDPSSGLHLLLQTSDINTRANSLHLYHAESGEVETLPLAYPWVRPFSPLGDWLMLDQDGNYQSLWFRSNDPPGNLPRRFMDGAREYSWMPLGGAIVVRGPQENQVSLVSFPQGKQLAAWTIPGYPYGSLATWSPQGDALAVLGYAYGGQDSALFLLNMPADRD